MEKGIGVAYKNASPARQKLSKHDAADQRGEDAFVRRRRPLRAGRRPLPRVRLHRVAVHEVRLEQAHGVEVVSTRRVAVVVVLRRELGDHRHIMIHLRPAYTQVLADAVAQDLRLGERYLRELLQARLDGTSGRARLPLQEDDVRERHGRSTAGRVLRSVSDVLNSERPRLGALRAAGGRGSSHRSCEW